jgi:activator of 2-hydroxyglutaryl-CoA dehydratase
MYWGIDVGSTYTKIAGLDEARQLVFNNTIHTMVHQDQRVREVLADKTVMRMVPRATGARC